MNTVNIIDKWKKASLLNSNYNGCLIALDSNLNDVHFSTYFINNLYFCKLWQYQFGNANIQQKFIPAHIHYWIPINDCNFNDLNWKSNNEYPNLNEEIVCWVNYDINGEPLRYIGNRIHFGFYKKSLFFKGISSNIKTYINIPFKNIFRWCSIEDFVKVNGDPRTLSLDPKNFVDVNWLLKIQK